MFFNHDSRDIKRMVVNIHTIDVNTDLSRTVQFYSTAIVFVLLLLCKMVIKQTTFDILKFKLVMRLRGHKQRELNDHVYLFLFLCPLSLIIELNFNISKVTYRYFLRGKKSSHAHKNRILVRFSTTTPFIFRGSPPSPRDLMSIRVQLSLQLQLAVVSRASSKLQSGFNLTTFSSNWNKRSVDHITNAL